MNRTEQYHDVCACSTICYEHHITRLEDFKVRKKYSNRESVMKISERRIMPPEKKLLQDNRKDISNVKTVKKMLFGRSLTGLSKT